VERLIRRIVPRASERPIVNRPAPYDATILENGSAIGAGVQELDDSDLAAALGAGDQDALAELYDRYRGLAYLTAFRILRDRGRAEDVVQDAFLKLWNNAAQFVESRGSLRTWLITAVRRRAIDRLRGRAAHELQECELKPGLTASGRTSDPWCEVSDSADRAAVHEALRSLPLEQRLAVELAFLGSYTQPEIAGMMGVSLGTVKGRTRLGLKKLSSYLQGSDLIDS
jgi:RNA polymerase sigma-70 factor (ECF subfamily)